MTSTDKTSAGGALRWLRTARLGPLRGGGLWGSLAITIVYLAISVPQFSQPYVIDEAVFPYVAEGILRNGAPVFYNGETRPADVGLWHPPLYDYLLALQVFIWGVSPFAVRAFGAVCVIASFYFLTLALRRLAPELKQYGYLVLAATFLLNPLVISDALVPDIDGTLGLLVVAVSLWLATVVAQEPISRAWALGVVAFATVAVSTKFTLAAVVALIVGCAALLSPLQRWRKVGWVIAAFAAGTGISLGLLFGAGRLVGFDARGPFDYLFASLGSRGPGRSGVSGAVTALITGPGSNLVWIGPAIMAAAILSLALILVLKPPGVSTRLVGLFVVGSLVLVLGYSYISASPFGFPKYTAIAVPGFAIGTAMLVGLDLSIFSFASRRSPSSTRLLWSAYAVALVVGAAGVVFLAWRMARTPTRDISQLVPLTLATFAGVALLTVIVALALAGGPVRRAIRGGVVVGAVTAALLTPAMVQVSSSFANLTADYATRYYYGERGMGEFLERADELIPPGAAVIAAKDIGLQLDRPFYEDASLLYRAGLPTPIDEYREELLSLDVPYVVTRTYWDYSEAVFPDHFDVLRELYEPVLEGPDFDFTLWKLK